MSTRTLAPAPAAPTAPAPVVRLLDDITADDLAQAVAAMDTVGATTAVAGSTLRAATLARFYHYSATLASTVEGVEVLPSNYKGIVQGLVWRDVTGEAKPVPKADRTAGTKLMGEYLSEFVRVACDPSHGIAAVSTPAKLTAARKAQQALVKKASDSQKLVNDASAEGAFGLWLESSPESLAITRAIAALADNSASRSHIPAFIARLNFVASQRAAGTE